MIPCAGWQGVHGDAHEVPREAQQFMYHLPAQACLDGAAVLHRTDRRCTAVGIAARGLQDGEEDARAASVTLRHSIVASSLAAGGNGQELRPTTNEAHTQLLHTVACAPYASRLRLVHHEWFWGDCRAAAGGHCQAWLLLSVGQA